MRKEEKYKWKNQQYIDRAEHALYKVYNRFPVVFDHGEGVKLYDTDGQEYLDFGAGIAVMGLGYSCDEVKKRSEGADGQASSHLQPVLQ